MTTIAIIGAGLSGLTVAHTLKTQATITIFEKARGVSGRMSTRRAEPYFFDHGAQFFTAKTTHFQTFLAPLISAGIIKRWDANFVEMNHKTITKKQQWNDSYPHYVGVPGMNAIAKHLGQGLDVRLQTRVQSLTKQQDQWLLHDEHGNELGTYNWVIITAPAEQTAALLPADLAFYPTIQSTTMAACFSLMLGFQEPLPIAFDAALVRNADISWISVNSSKPGRNSPFCLLVHSSNQWADQHIDDNREDVMIHLKNHTSEILGHDVNTAHHQAIHGWRYANITKQTGETHYIDKAQHIGVCGDWLIQGRVEAAFTSGFDLANTILPSL